MKNEPTEDGANRRSHQRFDASLSVDYRSGETFLFSYITNISEMGIFIRSDDPMPVGTGLQLRFTTEDADPLELRGEVVWVNPVRLGANNLNPGMGVRFEDLDQGHRGRLVDLVRTVAYLRDQARLS